MSETVCQTGKLKEIALPKEKMTNEELEELFKLQGLHVYGVEGDGYVDSNEIVKVNDKYYQILEQNEEGQDIFKVTKNLDGTISFIVQYYNGGCCLSEALEIAIKYMKEV